ncbi:MAG: hypothetical protein CMO46_11930 [Verrucomicrobiales bacterium]|nr:hypothetical protein [Verrucomicrobiales bacterium]
MNNLYITLIILLGILLIFQTLGNKARLRKLVKALKKNDRKLLNEKLSFGSSTAYKDLEKQIIEQIFEAENLEKRVVRREDLISSVVDGLSDAVIVFDKSFKIRFTNPSACRLFGWASPPLELNAVEQMSNDKLIKLIEDSFTNPKTETIEIKHKPLGSQDLLPRILEVELAPLALNENKSVNRARLVLKDVTDARNLDLVRKDFVANASHELRTPLTIINGYLENLIEDKIEDKELSINFLNVMQKHGLRLARIIEDMLTISKLESHSETIQIKPFNLLSCTEEVIARLGPLIDQKEAKLDLVFSDNSIINGDVFYWGQILFNLIENALKENEENGIVITVSLIHEDTCDKVIVSDNGVGIPANSIDFIFKRFYRVDQSRGAEKKGTGLGLSIVKRAIDAHGGDISVSSTPGIITSFTISLPKVQKGNGLSVESLS